MGTASVNNHPISVPLSVLLLGHQLRCIYYSTTTLIPIPPRPTQQRKMRSAFAPLALDGTAIWYQCLSGDFYNLYDENDAAQCSPVYINAIGGGSSASASASGVASQIPDGQVTASPVPSAAVCQLADGQPQNDANCVSQIGDGQIQAPTGAPVTQISDGQIQAPTSTAAPATQIGDGQIQAPSAGTGTPAAPPNGTAIASPTMSPSASAEAYTGAAATFGYSGELFAIAAGLVAVAML